MGSIYKRGNTWWIRYRENGKNLFESSKSKKKSVAVELLKKREGEIQKGEIPGVHFDRVKFDDLAEDFLWDQKMNYKGLYIAEIRVRHLNEHFEGMPVTRISDTHIRRYIETRLDEGAAPGTVNRELSALRRMFNLAADKRPPKVDRNQVPKITMLKEDNVRKGFFEYGDFLLLLDALPEYMKPFCLFAYKTGWRKGEISDLKWKQVDLKEACARLEPGSTKNGKGRTVYFDDELKEVMQGLHDRRKLSGNINPHVFLDRTGKNQIGDIRKGWKNACAKAGIGKRIFHDFRRTAVRNMVRSGISEHTAMKISGHRTRAVFDRYDIVSDKDLRQAAQKQAVYLASVTKTVTIHPFKEKKANQNG